MEAVKQWVYQPTLLNGEPAEVMTQIDVNFALSDGQRALQAGQVGQLYRQVLQADGPTAGGTQTWSLLSGKLPSGLSLDASTGAILGKYILDAQGHPNRGDGQPPDRRVAALRLCPPRAAGPPNKH